MKIILFISCFTILIHTVTAQINKFTVGLEYSLSFSNVTSPFTFSEERFMVSHNAFIKSGYVLKTNLQLTFGGGFLNTRQFRSSELVGPQDVKKIESYRNHNYFVVPVGLQYNFGSFYINPEVGIGIDMGHPVKQVTYFNDGSIIELHGRIIFFQNNEITFPVFLNFGNEFDLGNWKILLGAKAYYSLSKISTGPMSLPEHYYGFGIVTGVKF